MTTDPNSPATTLIDTRLALAIALANESRPRSLARFRTPLDVESKADESPVTIADREVEAAMRERINTDCPADGIYGEEHGRERLNADFVWVLDPIDGTRSYITGSPLWGTLIALLWRGQPVLGLVDIPATSERWLARAGTVPTFMNRPCRTSGCAVLADARVYTTSPDVFDAHGWQAFERVSRAARTRRFGGDCYNYGLVASGHVDLVIESGLQPYDYLAMVPLIEGAGGRITDWDGAPLGLASDGRVVAAATPALHAQALQRLRG